jgi:hypothetical protein
VHPFTTSRLYGTAVQAVQDVVAYGIRVEENLLAEVLELRQEALMLRGHLYMQHGRREVLGAAPLEQWLHTAAGQIYRRAVARAQTVNVILDSEGRVSGLCALFEIGAFLNIRVARRAWPRM